MVDYLPAIKQEKKAKEIIAPKLVSLYLYIGELLAMIKYAAEQEKLLQTGNSKIWINFISKIKLFYVSKSLSKMKLKTERHHTLLIC